nr:MAG TPA: hypothetical protein [Bacteriophage sp.]
MYLITTYPTEHKWLPDGKIRMMWNKVLPNGNYDFDDIIKVFQEHKEDLGIEVSDVDIAEIVNVEGILTMNNYMDFGIVEFVGTNHWYD